MFIAVHKNHMFVFLEMIFCHMSFHSQLLISYTNFSQVWEFDRSLYCKYSLIAYNVNRYIYMVMCYHIDNYLCIFFFFLQASYCLYFCFCLRISIQYTTQCVGVLFIFLFLFFFTIIFSCLKYNLSICEKHY